MKRSNMFFLFFSIIVLFSLTFVVPQNSLEGFDESLENTEREIEDLTDEEKWEEKWHRLGQDWKEYFLGTPLFSAINSSLKDISFVFLIFLGEPYSLTLLFFEILVFWLFLFFIFSKLLHSTGKFGNFVSFTIGVILSSTLSWLGVVEFIVTLFTNFAFYFDVSWVRVLVLFIGLAFLFLLSFVVFSFDRYISRLRMSRLKRDTNFKRELFSRFFDRFSKRRSYIFF